MKTQEPKTASPPSANEPLSPAEQVAQPDLNEFEEGVIARPLTSASALIDTPGVKTGVQHPSDFTDSEIEVSQLRILLAKPTNRELAKRLIAEFERQALGQNPLNRGVPGDLAAAAFPERLDVLRTSHRTEIRQSPAKSETTKPDTEPPRTKERIVTRLGNLWDRRDSLAAEQLRSEFQQVLDLYHQTKTLGSFETNRDAVKWVNFLAKKLRITLFLNGNAVTIKCNNNRGSAYFVPRQATRESTALKGAGSVYFPELSAVSRVAT